MSNAIRAYMQENNPEAINLDGLEAAIIGVGNQYTKVPLLIYSAKKIIRIPMKDGLTYGEALGHYEHNTACLWAGEGTPIIMNDLECLVTDEEDPPTEQLHKAKGKHYALARRRKLSGNRSPKRKDAVRVQGKVRSANRRCRPVDDR